ncbi:mitochondrial ribosomal death-associated protein 3 domain-containing protein [Ditylenchus destructor]|nr:mitochondrial ribosomal death-associated protein 3 domain-containing protein [Ditylenchus destructor]
MNIPLRVFRSTYFIGLANGVRGRTHKTSQLSFSTVSSNDMTTFTPNDIGKIYTVSAEDVKPLRLKTMLPSPYAKQLESFGECAWLVRAPLLEGINCLKAVKPEFPTMRLVLWGKFGTGKTMTFNQLMHYAYNQDYVIISLRSAMDYTRNSREGLLGRDKEASTYKKGRIDTPKKALEYYEHFKVQNKKHWDLLSTLKTEKTYVWNERLSTPEGSPITELFDPGLLNKHVMTDCVCAFWRELRRHASLGSIKLFVGLDHANSFFGKTLLRMKGSEVTPDRFSMINNFMKFFRNDWSNGACVLIADKAEFSDVRDNTIIPLHTPQELFGDKGIDAIDPFIPIETKLYNEKELTTIYEYYKEKNWLQNPKAITEEGRIQMMYLSAFNPYYFERMCAWM